MSRVTNPIVIYQANEAVALNGSYIETGTYNGEVIYGCDESTIRSVAKKYSEQLGSHYFMLTNVGEDYIYYGTPNKAVYDTLDDDTKEDYTIFPEEATLDKCEVYKYLGEKTDQYYNRLWKELKSY